MFGPLLFLLMSSIITFFSLLGNIFFGMTVGEFFLQFLFLSLLPLWYGGVKYIQNESSKRQEVTNRTLFMLFALIGLMGGLFVLFDLTIAEIVLLFTLFISIVFSLSSSYLFLIALILLVALAVMTSVGDQKISSMLALYTYYALAGGMMVEVFRPIWGRISLGTFSGEKIKWWEEYVHEIKWYMSWIIRSIPVILLLIFLQYFLREYLPFVFRPTIMGLSFLIFFLFIGVTFADTKIMHVSEPITINDYFVFFAGMMILWLYFEISFPGINTDFQAGLFMFYSFCGYLLFSRKIKVNNFLDNISH